MFLPAQWSSSKNKMSMESREAQTGISDLRGQHKISMILPTQAGEGARPTHAHSAPLSTALLLKLLCG